MKFLESVILNVLREAKHNGEPPLNAGEITRRANFPLEPGGEQFYRLARGLLFFLESKHDVERPAGKGWHITPQGATQE